MGTAHFMPADEVPARENRSRGGPATSSTISPRRSNRDGAKVGRGSPRLARRREARARAVFRAPRGRDPLTRTGAGPAVFGRFRMREQPVRPECATAALPWPPAAAAAGCAGDAKGCALAGAGGPTGGGGVSDGTERSGSAGRAGAAAVSGEPAGTFRPAAPDLPHPRAMTAANAHAASLRFLPRATRSSTNAAPQTCGGKEAARNREISPSRRSSGRRRPRRCFARDSAAAWRVRELGAGDGEEADGAFEVLGDAALSLLGAALAEVARAAAAARAAASRVRVLWAASRRRAARSEARSKAAARTRAELPTSLVASGLRTFGVLDSVFTKSPKPKWIRNASMIPARRKTISLDSSRIAPSEGDAGAESTGLKCGSVRARSGSSRAGCGSTGAGYERSCGLVAKTLGRYFLVFAGSVMRRSNSMTRQAYLKKCVLALDYGSVVLTGGQPLSSDRIPVPASVNVLPASGTNLKS